MCSRLSFVLFVAVFVQALAQSIDRSPVSKLTFDGSNTPIVGTQLGNVWKYDNDQDVWTLVGGESPDNTKILGVSTFESMIVVTTIKGVMYSFDPSLVQWKTVGKLPIYTSGNYGYFPVAFNGYTGELFAATCINGKGINVYKVQDGQFSPILFVDISCSNSYVKGIELSFEDDGFLYASLATAPGSTTYTNVYRYIPEKKNFTRVGGTFATDKEPGTFSVSPIGTVYASDCNGNTVRCPLNGNWRSCSPPPSSSSVCFGISTNTTISFAKTTTKMIGTYAGRRQVVYNFNCGSWENLPDLPADGTAQNMFDNYGNFHVVLQTGAVARFDDKTRTWVVFGV